MEKFIEAYWPLAKNIALICMRFDPRFKLDFLNGKQNKIDSKTNIKILYIDIPKLRLVKSKRILLVKVLCTKQGKNQWPKECLVG